MGETARIWFTPKQRAELWERWRGGQCVADIARALERRNKSGVYRVPARALKLDEREEISRGIAAGQSIRFTFATDVKVYLCDPRSPWQRGSNENTNGLLRQYFPKGKDLSIYPQTYLDKIAKRLNQRPRQTLGF
jgi:hypothetical protein